MKCPGCQEVITTLQANKSETFEIQSEDATSGKAQITREFETPGILFHDCGAKFEVYSPNPGSVREELYISLPRASRITVDGPA